MFVEPLTSSLADSPIVIHRSSFPLSGGFSSDAPWFQSLVRFVQAIFDSHIDSSDCVLWGAVLLGAACGMLGSFVVLRRQSLLGDAIGHAVLPGVVCGFLAAGSKSTPALLGGALLAGLLAAAVISLLRRTTVLKSSECMGVVFTGFYAVGIVMIKRLQNNQVPGQAGLERFLFGQIVGISLSDVILMAVITAAAALCVWIFWRTLAVSSFDHDFALSTGVRAATIELLLTTLLTVAIVTGIQAVGVVLVAAMLVTPAATAYLLTDRLHRMVILSSIFGAAAGVVGIVLSIALARPGKDMPTGATIVLAAGTLFGLVFLVAPNHGVLPRIVRLVRKRQKTAAENLLRTMYLIVERRGSDGDRRFGVDDIAALRHESPAFVRKLARLAAQRGWVDRNSIDPIILTDDGLAEARRVVRNHRLWELFLTQQANLAADHVHADAEYIEHVLPRTVVEQLERLLDQPAADPHGKAIPV